MLSSSLWSPSRLTHIQLRLHLWPSLHDVYVAPLHDALNVLRRAERRLHCETHLHPSWRAASTASAAGAPGAARGAQRAAAARSEEGPRRSAALRAGPVCGGSVSRLRDAAQDVRPEGFVPHQRVDAIVHERLLRTDGRTAAGEGGRRGGGALRGGGLRRGCAGGAAEGGDGAGGARRWGGGGAHLVGGVGAQDLARQ